METATVVPTHATWLPEDVIMLKSAIEEGASLEALAKGAVPFSRTFTLQEVHDRWHALLYDPEISAQACAHLCIDESDKPKEINDCHRKRKVGTLRKRYHDRVKRIRNEFFSSADLGFLTEPNLHNCTANGSDFHEHGTLHDGPQVGNAMLGDCIPDPFGLQATDFDILHQALPQVLTDLAISNRLSSDVDAFHSGGRDPLVNNHMSETVKKDCLRGFPVADSPFPVRVSIGIDGMPPFQPNNNESGDIPNNLHGTSAYTGKCLVSGGELSNTNVYTMGFSPPLPSMPLWKSMEDEAACDMPVNVLRNEKMHSGQNVLELPGNGNSKGKRVDKQNGESFINSASISDGDFADLPDSLFDFSNDDMLFMDVDGRDPVDKSCCDNTLSGVPMDMNIISTLKVRENVKVFANAVIATKPQGVSTHLHTDLGEEMPVSHVKVQMSSVPTLSNKPLERSTCILYCALNTEDPEIPCNDDIFLLIHPDAPSASSAMTSTTKSAKDPIIAKERNIIQGLNPVKRREELAQSSKHSLMFGSYMLPETGHIHTGAGIIARAEPNNTCKDLAPRHKAIVDPTQCKPAQTCIVSAAEINLDKDIKRVDSGAIKNPALLNGLPLHNELVSVDVTLSASEVVPSTSDQEVPESENEDPHFSDIEAMILDMDLRSYDDDLHFTRRASKYQQENSKRTIMRLEQCARASLQRAMTSKGAIAVLFGRRSRYFIRKKEVILGRSTEEMIVDIDLGKEGRHNKISRRQAIVKMEDDGSFSLKNLAKNPVMVNGAEVGTGELVTLSSSCLIEIRGIGFVFESNQKYVKQYLENIGRKNQGQMASFKCITKQEGG